MIRSGGQTDADSRGVLLVGADADADADAAATQRARVIAALVEVVAEHGYRATSVEAVIKRARVSRRTFYESFDSIEECFGAVLDDGLRHSDAIMTRSFQREQRWQDGVSEALAGLLVLFDSEPKLARVWFIESLAAASWAVERRERHVAELRRLVVAYWQPPRDHQACAPQADSALVVGVMAAVLGVIHTHLLTRQPQPLISLLGPLVGIVMANYLSPQEAACEVARAEERSRALLAAPYPPPHRPAHPALPADLPEPLRDPRAHRARACLLHLLEHPGASNREIATGVGMTSHTQASSLLQRLNTMGLLHKRRNGPGLANSWSLTELGVRTAHAIEDFHAVDLPRGAFDTTG